MPSVAGKPVKDAGYAVGEGVEIVWGIQQAANSSQNGRDKKKSRLLAAKPSFETMNEPPRLKGAPSAGAPCKGHASQQAKGKHGERDRVTEGI